MEDDPERLWIRVLLMVFVLVGFGLVAWVQVRLQKYKNSTYYGSNIQKKLHVYLFLCQQGLLLMALIFGWLGSQMIKALFSPKLVHWSIELGVIGLVFGLLMGIQWIFTKQRMRQSFPLAHTSEDMMVLLEEGLKRGAIQPNQHALLQNAMQFTDTLAREIMIPRTEMNCLYVDRTFEENIQLAMEHPHTRYPLCRSEKDHVIGFIHMKDLLRAIQNGTTRLQTMVRPLMTVTETTSISTLLQSMQEKRTEVALLIDEYGGTSGFVTVEDILEELVGEIYDEFDHEKPRVEWRDEHTMTVDGLLHLDDFRDYIDLDLPSEEYDTIGGWLYAQLDTPPQKNLSLQKDGYEFMIDELDQMRIARIKVKKLA